MRSTIGTRRPCTLIDAGYLLMYLLAGGIMHLWYYEWKDIEALEIENRRISCFRQKVHHAYGQMLFFSFRRKCVGVERRGFGVLQCTAYIGG